MQDLRRVLQEEQPHFVAELGRHAATMPPLVKPLVSHLLFAGGKRLRPLLCLLMGRLCGLHHNDLYTLGAAVEMLHAATLLHDDILDNADTRRGRQATHVLYGKTQTILAGDALLAKALHIVAAQGDARLTACISEAVLQTAVGEVEEIANIRNAHMTQEDYISIIRGKTAWMLSCACELAALRANASENALVAARTFGLALGMAFQIVDDVLDFSPATETGKPCGGDVREGKLTPPLLHYMQSLPDEEAARLRGAFCSNALSDGEVEALCKAIYEKGHAASCLTLSDSYLAQAQEALAGFAHLPEKELLLQMVQYVGHRSS